MFSYMLLLLATLLCTVNGSCPKTFRPFEEKACFYYQGYDRDTVGRDEAKLACKAKSSATLASIDNPEQELWLVNEFMTQDVAFNPNKHVTAWIGLMRAAPQDSRWIWEDASTSQYRNWGPNEPNNHRNIEDCGIIVVSYPNETRKYSWNDAVCQPTRNMGYSKASGYFCRLPYVNDAVNVDVSSDPKYSNIVRSNVALAITVVILLLIVLAFVGHALWSNREKILIKWPLMQMTKSLSMEELKAES